MPRVPRVTTSIKHVLQVNIIGEDNEPGYVRTDGGMVSRFLEFMIEHNVHAIFTPSVGGGSYYGYFDLRHKKRLEEFFKSEKRRSYADNRNRT